MKLALLLELSVQKEKGNLLHYIYAILEPVHRMWNILNIFEVQIGSI